MPSPLLLATARTTMRYRPDGQAKAIKVSRSRESEVTGSSLARSHIAPGNSCSGCTQARGSFSCSEYANILEALQMRPCVGTTHSPAKSTRKVAKLFIAVATHANH